MKTIIHRFRPINLLIVLLTQLFFLHIITLPFLAERGITPSRLLDYYLIIMTTIIVCAGGYIINDLMDVEIDKINKPGSLIQNVKRWQYIYKGLFVSGLLLTFYFSIPSQHPFFVAIYLLAWTLLNAYSKKLKCTPLWGNLVVAAFSAFVVAVILGPQFAEIMSIPVAEMSDLIRPFSFYFIFAFMISLIREIVKDLQDREGDSQANCRTLVVEIGESRTQIFAAFFITILIFALAIWQFIYYAFYPFWSLFLLNLLITVPLLYSMWLVLKKPSHDLGQAQKHYKKISTMLKYIMLAGIAFLLLEYIDLL